MNGEMICTISAAHAITRRIQTASPSEKNMQAECAQWHIAPFRLRYKGDEKVQRSKRGSQGRALQGQTQQEKCLAVDAPYDFCDAVRRMDHVLSICRKHSMITSSITREIQTASPSEKDLHAECALLPLDLIVRIKKTRQ